MANIQVGRGESSLVQLEVLGVLAVDMLDELAVPELLGTMKAGRQLGLVPGLRFFFRI